MAEVAGAGKGYARGAESLPGWLGKSADLVHYYNLADDMPVVVLHFQSVALYNFDNPAF